MKRLLLAFIVLCIPIVALSQTPPPAKVKPVSPLLAYSGDWTSVLNGKAWLWLKLELHGDQLLGSLVHPKNVVMSESGDVKSVSEEQSTESVTEAVLNPDGLLLSLKDSETQEPNHYVMRLVLPDKTNAELKMIGMSMPPGMSKPKPWRLVKSGTAVKSNSGPSR